MKRLSDVVAEVPCAYCGKVSLRIMHAEIGSENVTVAVGCICRGKDVLRFNLGEFIAEDAKGGG